MIWMIRQVELVFQSTPPARGATCGPFGHQPAADISIHAPREGGDKSCGSLCGSEWLFQSTPPARGATKTITVDHDAKGISIHAPREGGDNSSME